LPPHHQEISPHHFLSIPSWSFHPPYPDRAYNFSTRKYARRAEETNVNPAIFARRIRLSSIILAVAAFGSLPVLAQQLPSHETAMPQPQSSLPQPPASENPLFPNNNPRDPEQARMMRDMSKERSALRQKQIVDETNQLLDLANKLKDAVDKSSKDQLSLSVVNTATEIEKLAKAVKEKMRDGQ